MAIQSSILGTYCVRILGWWAVVHSILITIGGIERWAGPAFEVVKIMPYAPYTWAIMLFIGGVLVLLASYIGRDLNKHLFTIPIINKRIDITYQLLKNLGLWIIAIWTLLFALGVMTAMASNESVSLAAATRDLVICVLSVMMTKAIEPRYIKNDT